MDYTAFENDVISDIEYNWQCTRSDAQSLVEAAEELIRACYDAGDSAYLAARKLMA